MIGSSMGALLAKPALLSPIFKGTIFERHPYFLPNLVAAGFIIFAVIMGALFLKETRVMTASEKKTSDSQEVQADERSPLLRENRHVQQSEAPAPGPCIAVSRSPDGAGSLTGFSTLPSNTASGSCVEDLALRDEDNISEPRPIPGWNLNMVLLILQLSLVSYLQMVYGVIMPIYLVDAPSPEIPEGQFDPRGGLGFTVRQVGGVMSANGLVAIIVQGVIFTPFVRKFGVWKSFVWLTVLAPLSYVIVPFITMVPESHTLSAIYLDLFLQNFMNIIVYPCLLILLKDSTPSMSILGQVNGVAMMCCSGARTIAPPLVGYIYGAEGSAAGWWSISLVAIIAGLLVPTIRRPSPVKEVRDHESGN